MKKIESNNSVELFNTLKDVVNYVESNFTTPKYSITGDIKKFESMEMLKTISELGIRDKKRFKRFLNKVIGKKSLRSINTLLRFLSYQYSIGDPKNKVQITEPKHEEIQKLRKEWKTLQAKADLALNEYKTLKGDYYKVKEKEVEKEVA